MGKRELFIVIAFVAAGALAYHLTAPPPKAGERGFSLSSLLSGIRRQVRSNAATATVSRAGTVALRPGVTELRLTASRSVPLTVTGEQRDDIGYDLAVESSGPDQATALDWAGRARVTDDDLGFAQALAVRFPNEGTQTARLTLRVPTRLLVRVENAGRVAVSGVRAVDLRNLTGEATLTDITGPVTGSHRSGDLTVTQAGAVTLSLTSSRAKLTGIKGPIELNGRSGDCTITQSDGTIEAVMSNAELTVTEHRGAIKVLGEGGTLRLAMPSSDLAVDVRRMLVDVTLGAALPATIITTDEPLRLTLAGPPKVNLDAVAGDGGAIRASDFGLDATRQDRESRLSAPIGGGGPRLVLRNTRADIVISLRK
jgi:hypothetical protein